MTEQSHNRPLMLVLFLGVLIAALDIAMVGPALPALRDHYGIDERAVAWVLNLFVLSNLIGVPVMSKLADTRGRRFVFILDLSIFSIGALIVAAAPPFWVVLVGRALQGLGAAGLFPVSSAVVGDTFPRESQGGALGILGSVFGVAFLVGPAASGILLQYSWQWLFLLTPSLAGVAIMLGRKHIPVARTRGTTPSFDYWGLAIFTAAVATVAYGINGIDAVNFFGSVGTSRVWVYVLAGVILGALYARHARLAESPVISPAIFDSTQARLALALTVSAGFCEAIIVFIPSVAEATFGVSKSAASFMLLPLAAAVAVGSPLFGRLLDRIGVRFIVLTSSLLLSIGLFFIAASESLVPFYGGSVLIGVALGGLLGSSLNYIILGEARLEDRAAAQGIVTLSLNVGLLLGGAAVGALAASGETRRAGYEAAFFTIATLAIVMFAISLFLQRRSEAR